MFECELKFVVLKTHKTTFTIMKHQHPCYEIVFYIRGEGEVTIGGQTHKFHSNTFSVCEPNTYHKEIGSTPADIIYIGFEIKNKDVKLKNGLYLEEKYHILDDLLSIHKEMKSRHEHYGRMMDLFTEKIIIKLKRELKENSREEEQNNVIHTIQDYIRINCMKTINAKMLADVYAFNYDYLRRMFKKKTGITLKDYIQKEKIKYAISLLQNKTYSIKEVASMAGFSSASHFGSVFKEDTGQTPKEFIKSYFSGTQHKVVTSFGDDSDARKNKNNGVVIK